MAVQAANTKAPQSPRAGALGDRGGNSEKESAKNHDGFVALPPAQAKKRRAFGGGKARR